MNYASVSLSLSPPDLRLLTRFPSLLPPASVNQKRSDKIRPLTSLFVCSLVPLSLLCPGVFFVFSDSGVCRVGFYGSLCDVSGASVG